VDSQNFPAHLNVDYSAHTLLPTVNTDQELVRSYLQHFLRDAANTADFEPYIDNTWLTHLYAETKVENGLGDAETWASKLPPDHFARLRLSRCRFHLLWRRRERRSWWQRRHHRACHTRPAGREGARLTRPHEYRYARVVG
jgi:hypothetical protein